MEYIKGFFSNDGTPVESLDKCDYIQLELNGKHAKNKNAIALVSKETLNIVLKFKWYLGKNGYPVTYQSIDQEIKLGKPWCMHKIITPRLSKGYVIDHINRNKLDNRLSNLRICTSIQNSYNTSRINNKYKGVKKGSNNTWNAIISKDGKIHEIKNIKTEKEAAKIYDFMAEELFGQYAGKNFE